MLPNSVASSAGSHAVFKELQPALSVRKHCKNPRATKLCNVLSFLRQTSNRHGGGLRQWSKRMPISLAYILTNSWYKYKAIQKEEADSKFLFQTNCNRHAFHTSLDRESIRIKSSMILEVVCNQHEHHVLCSKHPNSSLFLATYKY